jgi:hypothetical protein
LRRAGRRRRGRRANRGNVLRSSAFICLTLVIASAALAESPTPNVTHEPARETFLLVPLNVHVLSCADLADVDCKLSDADIARIVGKVNGVWHKAGVHFCLDSVLREEAENVGAFEDKRAAPGGAALLSIYRLLAPAQTRGRPGLHVYYVHELPPNGVYLGQNICFVKETAALRKVEGGIDEPLPRVTSHELGHGLGLPHRQDTTNLMASGTTGTILNASEVAVARSRAEKVAEAMTVEACRGAAEAAKAKGEAERARLLERYLGELPK